MTAVHRQEICLRTYLRVGASIDTDRSMTHDCMAAQSTVGERRPEGAATRAQRTRTTHRSHKFNRLALRRGRDEKINGERRPEGATTALRRGVTFGLREVAGVLLHILIFIYIHALCVRSMFLVLSRAPGRFSASFSTESSDKL